MRKRIQCSFSLLPPFWKHKVGLRSSCSVSVYPAQSLLGNGSVNVPAEKNKHATEFWMRRFLCRPCRIKVGDFLPREPSDNNIWSRVSLDCGPRITVLARPSSNFALSLPELLNIVKIYVLVQYSDCLDDRGTRFRFAAGRSLLLSRASRPALGPTLLPIQWVPRAIFPGSEATIHLHVMRSYKCAEL
jgi:hypothetical protein